MKPVQPVTNTSWYKYERKPYTKPCGQKAHRIEKTLCTFEEVFEKAMREQEMIQKNDKGYEWKGR